MQDVGEARETPWRRMVREHEEREALLSLRLHDMADSRNKLMNEVEQLRAEIEDLKRELYGN